MPTHNDTQNMVNRTDFEQGELVEELKVDMSDKEALDLVKKWRGIASKLDKEIKNKGQENKKYYIGDISLAEDISNDRSKVQDNRIFTDLETVVPLVTSKPAQPVVFMRKQIGQGDRDELAEQAAKNQKVLISIGAENKLQAQFEKLVRQHQIYKIGMFKYGIDDGKIFSTCVLPTRLLLDSEATSVEDSEFVGEKVVSTAKSLIERYKEKEEKISESVSGKLGTKVTYEEWWTDDMLIIAYKDLILEKKKNPLFDWEGKTEEKVDEFGKKVQKTTKNNFFNRPRKPYVAFNVYNLGESLIDDVTSLELSKSLQDDINKGKRQISDNADKVGNPIRVGRGMTDEQIGQINSELEAGDAVNLGEDQQIEYVQANPLPSYVINRVQDSRNSIDNIFGIHSTTRGEREAKETATGREILRSGDEDRQATIGRAVERVYEELYEAYAHLVKMFYKEAQLVPVLGETDTEEYIEFNRDDIAEGMKIRVKPGSTVPDDKIALRSQALQLAQAGLITKKRLYEALGYDDADDMVKELDLEAVETQMRQQKELEKEEREKAKEGQKQNLEQAIASLGGQVGQTQQVQ